VDWASVAAVGYARNPDRMTEWALEITAALQEQMAQQASAEAAPGLKSAKPVYPAGLTAREAEILRLLARGLADTQIAESLFISPRTVNAHITSIYSKLGVNSRVAATRFATENGLA
jgi:DNA-binding NarL/FixJ family response regulator